MDLNTGHAVPVPTALDYGGAIDGGRGAFDLGLSRRGWTAVQVEYQVGAIADGGDVRQPVLLPQAWSIYPAATDDLLLIRRYFGRSSEPGEHTQVMVVGPDGQVHRSMALPFPFLDPHGFPDGVVGEVDAGVVTARGIVGWDGQVTPLPVEITGNRATDPRPFGVLAGRVIVFQHPSAIESVDLTTGSRHHLAIPAEQLALRPPKSLFGLAPPPSPPTFEYLVRHNAAGTWLTSFSHGLSSESGRLLAGPRGELRWLPAMPYATWFEDRLLLQAYDMSTIEVLGEAIEYDPASDTKTPVTLPQSRSDAELSACVGVTGRLSYPTGRQKA
jgi:hypothetical protein